MSLLENIVGGLAGQLSSGGSPDGPNALMQMVAQLVSSQGGLAGLLQKFQAAGHGSAVDSWVGTGANQPISGDQILGALGSDQVARLAEQHGMNSQQAAHGLAQVLPAMIDKLTPAGAIDQSHSGGELERALGGLLQGGIGGLGLGSLGKLFGN